MKKKEFLKILIMAIVIFLFSCSQITYFAPQEASKIQASKKIWIKVKDQSTFVLRDVKIENDKIIGAAKGKLIAIDFAEIESVWVERTDLIVGYAVIPSIVIAILLINGINTAPPPPPPSGCCPFIYSFDGDKFVFDAEPLGAAICQGLKRSEWCGLDHLKAVDGRYRLKVANEMDETQSLDEIKLLVVDHPPGTRVVPDYFGNLQVFSHIVYPASARDGQGRNILPLLGRDDNVFWQSREQNRPTAATGNPRDELVLEFPKPENARQVKLLADAWTTMAGARAAKEYLAMMGDSLDRFYQEINSAGPALQKYMAWLFEEELYLMRVYVETPQGWSPRGVIVGGGPYIAKEKAYVLDIADVPGDILRIKLMPPEGFWMIDRLATDFNPAQPVPGMEISAIEASGAEAQEKLNLLAGTNNRFLVMPEKGESFDLVFPAPAEPPSGTIRSVILKASGFYTIHLEARGECREELKRLFFDSPGLAIEPASRQPEQTKKNAHGK